MTNEKKQIYSWALYDWANSAFATTVMAGFFPVFFKKFWSTGVDPSVSTFKLGMANTLTGIIIACIAPMLGAIADRGGKKRKFLLMFMLLGASMTACLSLVEQGGWQIATLLYAVASIGFFGGIAFNDSQLTDIVVDEKKLHSVSALGYSLGYLGGGVLFSFNIFMTIKPEIFGFADAGEAVRFSFLTVGIWWVVFSIPVLLFVKDPPSTTSDEKYFVLIKESLQQLKHTIKEISHQKQILMFLLAFWLYNDGVNTVVKMAVDYGMSLGFDSNALMTALLITQFVGFPAAIGFGYLGNKIGAKASIFIALTVYTGVTIYGYFMTTSTDFFALAVVIGLVQGGIQSLSRSLFANIIPKERSAEYFGFFNIVGKFVAVLGPMVMGLVAYMTGSNRMSILSLIFFFVVGGILLHFTDIKKGIAEAAQFKSKT